MFAVAKRAGAKRLQGALQEGAEELTHKVASAVKNPAATVKQPGMVTPSYQGFGGQTGGFRSLHLMQQQRNFVTPQHMFTAPLGSKPSWMKAPSPQQQARMHTSTIVAQPKGNTGGGGAGGGGGTGDGTGTATGAMSTAAKLVAGLSVALGTADAALNAKGADEALEAQGASKEQIAYAKLVVKVLKEMTPECDGAALLNALTAFGSAVTNKDAVAAARAIGSAATVASSDPRFKFAMGMAQAGAELFSSKLSVEQGVLGNPAAMTAAEGLGLMGPRLGLGAKAERAGRGFKAFGQGYAFTANEGVKQEKLLTKRRDEFAQANIPKISNDFFPIDGVKDPYPVLSDEKH